MDELNMRSIFEENDVVCVSHYFLHNLSSVGQTLWYFFTRTIGDAFMHHKKDLLAANWGYSPFTLKSKLEKKVIHQENNFLPAG